MHKSLPFSEDAEAALLSSMIQSKDVLAACVKMSENAFYMPRHQLVFNALKDLHAKNKPVDFPILKHYLEVREYRKANQLEEIGGVDTLNDLFHFVPIPDNWRHYMKFVTDHHRRREAIQACNNMVDRMYDLTLDLDQRMSITV